MQTFGSPWTPKAKTIMVRVTDRRQVRHNAKLYIRREDGTFGYIGQAAASCREGYDLDTRQTVRMDQEFYLRKHKSHEVNSEYTLIRRCDVLIGMELFRREGAKAPFESLGIYEGERLIRGRRYYCRGPIPVPRFEWIAFGDVEVGMTLYDAHGNRLGTVRYKRAHNIETHNGRYFKVGSEMYIKSL